MIICRTLTHYSWVLILMSIDRILRILNWSVVMFTALLLCLLLCCHGNCSVFPLSVSSQQSDCQSVIKSETDYQSDEFTSGSFFPSSAVEPRHNPVKHLGGFPPDAERGVVYLRRQYKRLTWSFAHRRWLNLHGQFLGEECNSSTNLSTVRLWMVPIQTWRHVHDTPVAAGRNCFSRTVVWT